MSEVPESIWAMDRLNSWIRSNSFRAHNFASPRHAIYWLKGEALTWAHQNLSCLHSSVRVTTQCRDCDGTGCYTDSYGTTFPHCRACGSCGQVSLTFVQSFIQGGPVWHTPWNKFWLRGIYGQHPNYYLARVIDGEWTVNQVGRDLTPDEIARDLNTVEQFWQKRPDPYYTDWGGPFDDFKFTLYAGATPRETCSLCGNPNDSGCGCRVTRFPIEWTDHACKRCETIHSLNSG